MLGVFTSAPKARGDKLMPSTEFRRAWAGALEKAAYAAVPWPKPLAIA